MLEGPPEALLYYDLVCMWSVVILKKGTVFDRSSPFHYSAEAAATCCVVNVEFQPLLGDRRRLTWSLQVRKHEASEKNPLLLNVYLEVAKSFWLQH